MEIAVVQSFFVRYLLMPLIVIIMAAILMQMRKRVPKIKTRKLIVYLLVASLLLAVPGLLGFTGNLFNPYWYLLAMIYYGLLGALHVNLLKSIFKDVEKSLTFIIVFETVLTVASMLLGAYLFVYIYDWMSAYEGYAIMSATSILIFIVPLVFYYCYLQFMNIPFDIYKTWQMDPYKQPANFDGVDFDRLMVLNIELTKNIEDGNRFRIKAKTIPEGVAFGDWFYRVIDDYNHKNPNATIKMLNENEESYSWIFYTKKSVFHFRRYIDFEQDILQNKIIENDIVICKRVIQHEEEDVVAPRPLLSND